MPAATTKPTVGRIVHVLVDPRQNGGSDVASAIVTRVLDDETVNVRVFNDGDTLDWLTNVVLVSKRPDEEAELVRTHRVCFFPPRS